MKYLLDLNDYNEIDSIIVDEELFVNSLFNIYNESEDKVEFEKLLDATIEEGLFDNTKIKKQSKELINVDGKKMTNAQYRKMKSKAAVKNLVKQSGKNIKRPWSLKKKLGVGAAVVGGTAAIAALAKKRKKEASYDESFDFDIKYDLLTHYNENFKIEESNNELITKIKNLYNILN